MAINLDQIYQKQMPNSSNTTSGVVGSGGVSVNAPSTTMQPDFSKYLYDSGLQNVFNDYQQNIALLNQQEQQQLQNAYTIREMSKKYLGEYASNVGIGDVSGNLLDIYSQYQQNIGDITAQSDMMALNLQQAFQQQSEQAFQQALQNQELQLQENAQNLFLQISRGDTGGVDWKTYLQNALDSGEIDQSQYNTLYSGVYTAKLDEFESNVSRNFFGFKTASDGTRVPMTAQEYLQENKNWLSPQDYQRFSDLIAYGEMQGDSGFEGVNYNDLPESLKLLFPSSSNLFSINTGDQTLYYASVNTNVDNEDIDNAVTTSELTQAFREETGDALISGQTIYEYNGTYYVYKDLGLQGGGTWFRLYNASNLFDSTLAEINIDVLKEWNSDTSNMAGKYDSNIYKTDYFEYDKQKETITTIGGAVYEKYDVSSQVFNKTKPSTYVEGSTDWEGWTQDLYNIYNAFRRASSTGKPEKYQIIVYNGNFYTIGDSGKLIKFRKTAT